MTALRVRSLSLKGFRAYGGAEQTLNLPSDIAAVWGPNSKGKTSLAEAFEFLLTGRITRRELMSSSQDEFADALRNAHLADGEEVYVAARVIAQDGTAHDVKRVLISDYTKRQDCAHRLEIDGAGANEAVLANLGLRLSQPPLQAPVLAQHTLSYIFSVRPQDRATYFKTLLEVTDLDSLRNDIASLASELTLPADPPLIKFDACLGVQLLQPALRPLANPVPGLAAFTAAFQAAAKALIESAGQEAPATLDERLAEIAKILDERRSRTFPLRGFERKELPDWSAPATDIWERLAKYVEERAKIDEQTRQLAALFDEALKIPAIAQLTAPADCPLCATASAISPERVRVIRQHVENTKGFKDAEAAAKTALTQLSTLATSLAEGAEAALPRYLKTTAQRRRETGFTVARMRLLLGERAEELLRPWLAQVGALARAGTALRNAARAASRAASDQSGNLSNVDIEVLRAAWLALARIHAAYRGALDAYKEPARALGTALKEVIDAQSDTAGWEDFLEIARQPAALRAALIERAARAGVERELNTALRQIDRAKEQVLEDKFSDYSDLTQDWWDRLRPEEPTFFSAVQPRKGARRTIDFKAGLAPGEDRSVHKVRDVIAVFSQSQLHCLGLALFLARAEHEGLGFIVLDDPVLSSDEDYRVHFNATALTALLALPMQVVVLTQDHSTWEELETRYRHVGISTAQLFVEAPSDGTVIENTSDALIAKLNRAKSLARGGHPDLRKECGIQLRDAGERFCKELLIEHRRANGENAASLSDYDGKTLEWLAPHIDPLLGRDPSHPGKFGVFKATVNRACHDNSPPGPAEMTQAHGEIRHLVKDYLRR